MFNVQRLCQKVHLLSQGLQLGADVHEAREHIGPAVGTIAVGIDNLLGGSQLETTNLHQIVDEAYLFDVLLLILAYLGRS